MTRGCAHCFSQSPLTRTTATRRTGTLCICWFCTGISIVVSPTEVRLPTELEQARIKRDPRIQEVLAAVHSIRDMSVAVGWST